MNFAFFLLLNAVLLIRPEELYPEIAGLRLYLCTVIPCVLTSLPGLARQLSGEALAARPVSVCVLIFYAVSVVSLVPLGRVDEAVMDWAPEFGKVVLFYFLVLAVVDTRERFRAYVAALVFLIAALTLIALAQFYGYAEFPNIVPAIERQQDKETGEIREIYRMTSSGIFSDPNDLCLVLGLGILCCVYLSTTTAHGAAGRLFWLLPIPVYVYGLMETQSRGGLLGVLAGTGAYLYSRYGGAKALPFAVAGGLAALMLVGGRQGGIGGGGTAHERVMKWASGLTELQNHPIFLMTGLGRGFYVAEEGLEAHNSFVQAYVEMGVLGGGAFLAAFYFAARLTDRLGRGVLAPGWVVQARHFGFAAVIAYAGGCYSLTRNFVIPTYLVLGLAGVLLDQAAWTLPEKYRVTRRWFTRFLLLSVAGVVGAKLMTMGLGQAGV
ncbi:MAG: hypothetical protein C0501_27660 [Isosphaera sp.]|nr:hypothetical protein [Isosphaera sp.]